MLAGLLRTHLRPYARRTAAVMALQLVQTFAILYLPTLNADIINNGVLREDIGHILRTGALMLVVTLVQALCAATAVYLSAGVAMGVGRDLRAALFSHVQGFSAQEMARFGAPSLITRSTNDVQQVQTLVLMAFTMMVTAPILGIGGVVMALGQDVPLSLLLIVVLPALVIVIVLILRRVLPLTMTLQRRIDTINRVLREQITGMRVVRAFVREDHERDRFDRANHDVTETALRVGRLQALMNPAVILIIECAAVAVLWFGGHRVENGSMEVGSVVAYLQYLTQILHGVMLAAWAFQTAPRARSCAQRIREVLDTRSSVVAPAAPVTVLPEPGRVRIRNAEFRFPGAEEPVLRGMDLVAEPGTTTAVVGSTGSGKTTLLSLIPRLIDASRGTVLVGGVDVRDCDPELLTRTVGLVPQRPYLFSGTIASNLRYGRPEATEDELWAALETAQAREFVEALPDGLDSAVGQGGSNLSGGQRQRLAIARVLVTRPSVYLFDDSFSALDYATEQSLRAALRRALGAATVLFVAQRISSVRDADRIVVLDRGRVADVGTHQELFDSSPTYREIVLSQLTEEEAV
ncbi:ABC transporter ATP-binding protein [Streptomyces sp. YIM 98790]|uniref:ABC transporter ATP-binding protein n=1 Tax=Streptomyces sp. YIM 98790 TaxID=2689077 RepID=UPI00140B3888|nr:ABC transporter ATP-binding protein [Streptomyces sp. YIM 98790]